MSNREEIQGRWTEVKGRLREHWGQLTDDDLQRAKGSAEQLVGVVQEKTGAAKSEVEQFINGVLGESFGKQASEAMHHYADSAGQMASEAADYARLRARDFANQSGDYAARLNETVRAKPAESLVIAFGLGIAAGAFFFLGRKRA